MRLCTAYVVRHSSTESYLRKSTTMRNVPCEFRSSYLLLKEPKARHFLVGSISRKTFVNKLFWNKYLEWLVQICDLRYGAPTTFEFNTKSNMPSAAHGWPKTMLYLDKLPEGEIWIHLNQGQVCKHLCIVLTMFRVLFLFESNKYLFGVL